MIQKQDFFFFSYFLFCLIELRNCLVYIVSVAFDFLVFNKKKSCFHRVFAGLFMLPVDIEI